MKNIQHNKTVRILAAILVAVAVIVLSGFAAHAPAQNQSSLTLNRIKNRQRRSVLLLIAAQRARGSWRPSMLTTAQSCAWFVEAVLPTGDSNGATENLKSVAATL